MFVRFAHDAGKNMLLRYNLRYLGIIPSLFEAGTDLRSVWRVNRAVAGSVESFVLITPLCDRVDDASP